MHFPLPQPLAAWSISLFATFYQINISEAEKPISEYKSIGDFFIRKLKLGTRPIGDQEVVHPADSVITQAGSLDEGTLIQAKGLNYSTSDFLVGLPDQDYLGGAFATYYLCPTDYHRVHSPIKGRIGRVIGVHGDLWPVNQWSTNNIPNLFAKNERVIIEILTSNGPLAFVMVGATNVGKMTLSFWPEFQTNIKDQKEILIKDFKGNLSVEKGQELGTFHMGSTVVLCLSKNIGSETWLKKLPIGSQVKVGSNYNS